MVRLIIEFVHSFLRSILLREPENETPMQKMAWNLLFYIIRCRKGS